MADPAADAVVPAELKVDPESGAVTLETNSNAKPKYALSITITQTGGNAADVTTISDVTIDVVCGPDSATVIPVDVETLYKGNIYDTALTASSKFLSSNQLCPVVSYELTQGAV